MCYTCKTLHIGIKHSRKASAVAQTMQGFNIDNARCLNTVEKSNIILIATAGKTIIDGR
jgi:hypothetical protein